MKGNILLKTTIIFFLLVNTSYYWEGKLGVFAMLSSILLAGAFIFLTIALLTQIAFAIREKFTNKKRLLLITVTLIILPLTYLYPNGIINFDRLEGENLLIAEREGVEIALFL